MSYPRRKLPAAGVSYGQTWWRIRFSSSEKVAVYWPNGPSSVTLVGYYDTVSEANAAALAARNASGAYPRVVINWWHGDVTRIAVGAISHRDARVDLPAWIDEDPAY
jgi:hypothetical protein